MKISPALAGFIKGIGVVIAAATAAYLSDPSHLTFLSGGVAVVVAGLFSSLESWMKEQSYGGKALFGAVRIKRKA